MKNETKNIGEALTNKKKTQKSKPFWEKNCCKDGDKKTGGINIHKIHIKSEKVVNKIMELDEQIA